MCYITRTDYFLSSFFWFFTLNIADLSSTFMHFLVGVLFFFLLISVCAHFFQLFLNCSSPHRFSLFHLSLRFSVSLPLSPYPLPLFSSFLAAPYHYIYFNTIFAGHSSAFRFITLVLLGRRP